MDSEPIIVVPTIFGFGRHGVEADDRKGELTAALISQAEERRRWWRPWKQVRLEGYRSPWEDHPAL